ncbi:MAG: hypothetical protein GW823_07875 [Bacteroidetes bacterium]|nr:hypothetical protein [Bacteroidota bacterium]
MQNFLKKIPRSELKICYRESFKVAAVVGTILSLINQYQFFIHGFNMELPFVKIGMNFLVPFCVATYSRLKILHQQHK